MSYADADTIIQAPVSEPVPPRRPAWAVPLAIAAWQLVAILTLILAGIVWVDLKILHL